MFPRKNTEIKLSKHTSEWVVMEVEPKPDFTLNILFASGEKKCVDMKPVIKRWITKNPHLFKPMQDINFFMRAGSDGISVAWSDQIDIAPEYLYEHGVPIEQATEQ